MMCIKSIYLYSKLSSVKKFSFLLLSVAVLFTACHKKDAVPVSMTVGISGDSTWTTGSVNSYLTQDGSALIAGVNTKTGEKVNLGLYQYREGHKVYAISSIAAGGSVAGSTAEYDNGAEMAFGEGGTINVTNFTTKTIEGNFDFTGSAGHVTGTFIAPIPQ